MVFKVILEFVKENGKTNFEVTLKSEMTRPCPNKESVGQIGFVSPWKINSGRSRL